MARKRPIDELEQLTDIDKPSFNTTLHGAITSLSPIKKGRKSSFFEGTIADASSKVRIVGFDPYQQQKMKDHFDSHSPIKLTDCQIKNARQGNSFEVLLKHSTKISESPKKINVSSLLELGSAITSLKDIEKTNPFERVTVCVKVIKTEEAEQVNALQHQNVYVGDDTDTIKISLWEDNINALETEKCYKLKNFLVKEFRSKKFLSMTKDNCIIETIPDIGTVLDHLPEEDVLATITNVQIIGILLLDKYCICSSCNARVEPLTPPLAKCSNDACEMIQVFNNCEQGATAKLLVEYEDHQGVHKMQVHVLRQLLTRMAALSDTDSEAPLCAATLLAIPKLKSLTYIIRKELATNFAEFD